MADVTRWRRPGVGEILLVYLMLAAIGFIWSWLSHACLSLLYLAWLRLTVPGGLPDLAGGRVENDPRSPGARC
jgi:uncharacterized membrane protein AbrB (regulator of aidB expression)